MHASRQAPAARRGMRAEDGGILERVAWPQGYRPPCPRCGRQTTGLREKNGRVHGHIVVLAVAEPCGCGVDEHAAALQSAAFADRRDRIAEKPGGVPRDAAFNVRSSVRRRE